MTILNSKWFEGYLRGLINYAKEVDRMDGKITLFYEEAEDICDTIAHKNEQIQDLRAKVEELEVIVHKAEKLENAMELLIEKGPEFLMDYIHHPDECTCKSCAFFKGEPK